MLGRMLLHAAAVGLAAGLVGSAFFVALELVQRLVLEDLAGYRPLRAAGERVIDDPATSVFRPWLLWVLPGLGALGGGLFALLFRGPRSWAAAAMYPQASPWHVHCASVPASVGKYKGQSSVDVHGVGSAVQ